MTLKYMFVVGNVGQVEIGVNKAIRQGYKPLGPPSITSVGKPQYGEASGKVYPPDVYIVQAMVWNDTPRNGIENSG